MLAKNNVEKLNDYVIDYIEDLFIKIESDGSHHTEKQYRRGIQNFIKYNFGYDLEYLTKQDLQKVDKHMILSYFNKMYKAVNENGEKLYKNSTINPQLSAVKKLMEYMDFIDVIDFKVSELSYIKNKKVDSESHETMPMNVVFAIIEDIRKNESRLPIEKEWFIKIAVETGLRSNDILKLTKRQFTVLPNSREVMLRSIGSNKGKGNKDWKEMISIDFYNDLQEALFNGERENLFTMSPSTIAKTIHRSQERLGIDKGYTPHSLKRTAVNNTRTFTNDLKAAQVKGKHSNSATTDIYLDEVEYGATGYFSMLNKTDSNLIDEVSHEELLKALDSLDDSTKLLINIKLQELANK